MKKALIITRVSGFLPQFEMNNVRILQSMGYEVHYAANFETIVYGKDNSRLSGTGIICHPVKMVRNPLSPKNLKAFLELKRLMQREKFDLVHCHMPVGGVLGRLAAYVTGTAPVIYTAHGFHFYKGAPVKNWIPYYLVERILAHMTDRLITINKEDYFRANTFLDGIIKSTMCIMCRESGWNFWGERKVTKVNSLVETRRVTETRSLAETRNASEEMNARAKKGFR